MSTKLNIHPLLLHITGGQAIVEVEGGTVGECLQFFKSQFPNSGVFDEEGKLRGFVGVFLNNRTIYPQGLDHPVKDKDELSLLMVIGGG